MNEEKYTELSKAQRLASNLAAAIGLLLIGGALLVAGILGADVIAAAALPIVLSGIGLVLLASALIQTNSVSCYLSVCLLVAAAVSYLANFLPYVGYEVLYPLYIAAPAIASLFTMLLSKEYRFHLKVIFIFTMPSALFTLQSISLAPWHIVLPLVVLYFGLLALYLTLSVFSKQDD